MSLFRDHIYVGTLRNALPLLKLFPPSDPPVLDPWPVPTPATVEALNLRAQIWRYSPLSGRWRRAFQSPLIRGRTGGRAPRDIGYRGMVVFRGASDGTEALYVSTISTVRRGTAALILRSADGEHFEPVSEPGLGNPAVSTFRSLVAFDGHLYAAPAGEGTSWNTTRAPVILRSSDPRSGSWTLACEPGFGDATNNGIFELAVFDNHLYASTFNYYEGCQVWKTPATGRAPCRWAKVLERGAYRGNLNEMILGMCGFGDALYVGTGIQNGGYDRWNRVRTCCWRTDPHLSRRHLGPGRRATAANAGGTGLSDLWPGARFLTASSRDTSGALWFMKAGCTRQPSTGACSWRMPSAHRGEYRELIREFGVDHMIETGAGFQLWRSRGRRPLDPRDQDGVREPIQPWQPHAPLDTARPFRRSPRTRSVPRSPRACPPAGRT